MTWYTGVQHHVHQSEQQAHQLLQSVMDTKVDQDEAFQLMAKIFADLNSKVAQVVRQVLVAHSDSPTGSIDSVGLQWVSTTESAISCSSTARSMPASEFTAQSDETLVSSDSEEESDRDFAKRSSLESDNSDQQSGCSNAAVCRVQHPFSDSEAESKQQLERQICDSSTTVDDDTELLVLEEDGPADTQRVKKKQKPTPHCRPPAARHLGSPDPGPPDLAQAQPVICRHNGARSAQPAVRRRNEAGCARPQCLLKSDAWIQGHPSHINYAAWKAIRPPQEQRRINVIMKDLAHLDPEAKEISMAIIEIHTKKPIGFHVALWDEFRELQGVCSSMDIGGSLRGPPGGKTRGVRVIAPREFQHRHSAFIAQMFEESLASLDSKPSLSRMIFVLGKEEIEMSISLLLELIFKVDTEECKFSPLIRRRVPSPWRALPLTGMTICPGERWADVEDE